MVNIINLTKMSLNNLSSVIKSIGIVFCTWIIVSIFSPAFLSMLFCIGSYLIVYQTMAYEDINGIDNLVSTLPIKRSEYVISRYILGIFGATISMILLLVVYFITVKVNKIYVPLELLITTGVLSSVLLTSVIIPIVLKFGVTKGKIINFLVLFVIISVGTGIVQEIGSSKESIDNIIGIISSVGFTMITVIISLLIITISMIMSLKLYKGKEIK
ncbi:ABC-2 transporter permease [Paraclostridium bifermentans]|uniref:ABC-2 transporter permease n=1 Tax=Paraclostridium bifermentans TaxID=1490 RepID=UPI0018A9E666|nr:ABC-2 transporter permease [Paraclostridium bifermentans]